MNVRHLYDLARGRHRPEDVAEAIVEFTGATLPAGVQRSLEKAAAGSLARRGSAYSSMATDFFRAVVDVRPQAALVASLLEVKPLTTKQLRSRDKVLAFVARCGELIGGLEHKLDKAQRHALGIYKGHRWYNKRRRLLLRIGAKLERQVYNDKRNALRRTAKTMLLSQLSVDDFARDDLTACFIAYYGARLGLRSVFTNTSQVRAFDQVSEVLFEALGGRRETAWFAVAHVMPDRPVVKHLTEEERGRLLGAAFAQLQDAADVLEGAWDDAINRRTMIVRRGFDSSTWNEAAGAWNKLRESWISLLFALGMEGVLEQHLPGKVMRVMAADVARWHQASGGDVHPDTRVWSALPPPWDVLRGDASCTREDVRLAVARAGAKPEGWLGPRTGSRRAEAFTPTPELVHGVAVSSPALAEALRKVGVFSGRALRGMAPPAVVTRDPHGAALFVSHPAGVAEDDDAT